MRTDSTRLSDTFVSAAQDYIGEKYGKEYIGKVKGRKEKKEKVITKTLTKGFVLRVH